MNNFPRLNLKYAVSLSDQTRVCSFPWKTFVYRCRAEHNSMELLIKNFEVFQYNGKLGDWRPCSDNQWKLNFEQPYFKALLSPNKSLEVSFWYQIICHDAEQLICRWSIKYLANIYLFKVNNRNNRKRCEICSKLTIKIPERRHWRRSGVFIVNFEYISHLFLVLLFSTLNK